MNRCPPPTLGEVTRTGKPIKQKIYWDTDVKGFGLLVGAQTKTFIMQRDMADGRTVRTTLGRFGNLTVEEARREARSKAVDIDRGIDPNAQARKQAAEQRRAEWELFTLAQAIDEHIASMGAKGCAARSMEQLREELERLVPDWLTKPLVSLRRKDCIERHRRLTTDNGPVVANRVMRMIRACWNSARRLYEELPTHPVVGIVFNKQKRRRDPVPWANLPEWWGKVRGLPNAIRRDLNLLMLFTGLRSTDARTVRWENIDFDKGTIHRPKPKGGEDRAFTVPLPKFMLRLLKRRRKGNSILCPPSDGGWVFPTHNRAGKIGPVAEPKEQRFEVEVGGKVHKTFYLPTPHRLRDTFATACLEAGVGQSETKILLNHTLANDDVTTGYQRPSMAHLRGCAEKVAAFLLKAKRPAPVKGKAKKKIGA